MIYVIRNKKNIFIVFVVLILISVTIGYALLNTTININGKSSISKNIWDVYFDNIIVNDGSVKVNNIPKIENSTTVSFEAELNIPGEFYEFTVDVVNNGTIDAMIESVEKTSNLTEEQQKYLNYIIEYQNVEQITAKQLIKVNEFVRLKVRVEYKKDINLSALPTIAETLNLGFTVNYVQSDGSSDNTIIENNGKAIKVVSGDGTQTSDEVCIGEECFYVMYSDEDTVTMFSKYNLYVGGEHDGSIWTAYGEEATGKQNSNMLGYVDGQSISKGTIQFSDIDYWTNKTSDLYVYDSNSKLYSYVENYKTYLSTLGVTPNEARLISKEELYNLGCGITPNSCISAPEWVYTTSYWSGTLFGTSLLILVTNDGGIGGNYYRATSYGLRPVIVISKSYL